MSDKTVEEALTKADSDCGVCFKRGESKTPNIPEKTKMLNIETIMVPTCV